MKNIITGTLLVVDDIPTNLKVLFTYLRNLDFKIRIAQDGEDALKQVDYAKPDLILLDVMMPKMDGFETCRRLKSRTETADIPVIFMTALTDVVDKVKGFEIGAVDYITKPIQHEEVLARINLHLTLRKLQQNLEERNASLTKMQDSIQVANSELQRKNAKIRAFSRVITHDLKGTLLSQAKTLHGLSNSLTEEYWSHIPDKKAREVAQSIKQTSKEMLSTIDTLILLTKNTTE
jgi:two-component system sensor histidine kinase/response regulator